MPSSLLILVALQAASAVSPPPPRRGFRPAYIGENGAYQHPGDAASDAIETGARQEGGQGTFGPISPGGASRPSSAEPIVAVKPEVAPPEAIAPAAPAVRVAGSAAPAVADTVSPAAAAAPASQEKDPQRYSLWDGLVAPLDLPAERVKDFSADDASSIGRKDYQTHILGAKAAAPEDRPFLPATPDLSGAGAGAEPPRVFVSVELVGPGPNVPVGGGGVEAAADPQWRDAVAALESAAGFRGDARFPPSPDGSGVTLRGWIRSDAVASAMGVAGVKKISVSRAAAASSAASAVSEVLVGIRVEGNGAPEMAASYAEALKRLSARTGFQLKRTIGSEKAPDGRTVVVAAGGIPLSRLSALMAEPSVAKILPSPDSVAPAAPAPPRRRGFMAYAVDRYPWIWAMTALLTLILLGGPLLTAAECFLPYRRAKL